MGNMTRLLLLLWAGVSVSTAVDLQKRIIGGHDCVNTERLYHVMLVDNNDRFFCGGSLIHEQWILTAAHCWMWGMKAVLGVHPGPSAVTVKIIAPPVIYGDEDKRIHDIMLLRLPKPYPNFPTVPLPDCDKKPKKGDKVQIAGHASTVGNPNDKKISGKSPILQCADIKVVDCLKAAGGVDNNKPWTYMHTFCAETANVDTCPGDSGGGYVFNKMIYGVHHGSGEYVCTRPVRFMDVCEYKNWIKKITDPNFIDKILDYLWVSWG